MTEKIAAHQFERDLPWPGAVHLAVRPGLTILACRIVAAAAARRPCVPPLACFSLHRS
jgi:hypothetical protein